MSLTTPWILSIAPVLSACSHEDAPPAPAATATATPAPTPATRPDEAFDHTHEAWTRILRAHVDEGAVDYRALVKDPSELNAYRATLAAVTPAELESWTRDQRFAFWINAYNANCIALVVEHYPVKSIKDIGTLLKPVWKKRFIAMPALDPEGKGRMLSLDVIEHEILRPRFKDARVHAAVNCASQSCPPLRPEAFVAERLDEQLDEQARAWLADPTRNRFDRATETVWHSAIFDWFREDFERDAGSVQAWIARYAPESEAWVKDAQNLRLETLDYSWKLNDLEP